MSQDLVQCEASPVRVLSAAKATVVGGREPAIMIAFGDDLPNSERFVVSMTDAHRLSWMLADALHDPVPGAASRQA